MVSRMWLYPTLGFSTTAAIYYLWMKGQWDSVFWGGILLAYGLLVGFSEGYRLGGKRMINWCDRHNAWKLAATKWWEKNNDIHSQE